MKKTIFISILSFGFALQAQTDKTAFSLDEAKRYAAENHFTAKNARYDSQIAKQDVNEIRAIGLPQVNAEGNFQNFINLPVNLVPANAFGFPAYLTEFLGGVSQATGVPINAPAPSGSEFSELQFGTNYNTSGGITVNQLIFDGSYIYGLRAAKAYAEMNKILEKKSVEDVEADVERAYYMVLIAQENVKLLTSSRTTVEDLYKQTKAFFEQGFLEEQDADQLQLTLASIDNSLNNATLQYDVSLQMLKYQMGYDLSQPISLLDNLETLSADVNTYLIKNDFTPNGTTQFQLLDYQEKLLTLNKKSEVAKIYPRLIGFFSHTENTYSNEFKIPKKWYPTTLWGLKLQVPIFGGGSYAASVKKTKIELARIQDTKKFTQDGLMLQYSSAKTEYTAALKESEHAKSSLELAKKIKEKTNIKFKAGVSSSLELTQAENQYLSAQGAYIGSLLKLTNTKVNLKKLTK